MTGTVEAIMADQAKKTVGQYVEYIGKYVEAALEDMNNMRRLQDEAAGGFDTRIQCEIKSWQQLVRESAG